MRIFFYRLVISFVFCLVANNLYAARPYYDKTIPYVGIIDSVKTQERQANIYYDSYQKSKKSEYLYTAVGLYKQSIIKLYNLQNKIQHEYRFFYQVQRLRVNICQKYERIRTNANRRQIANVPEIPRAYCSVYPPSRQR